MRALFPGHYKLTTEELDALWKDGTIIIDTNSLLNLYRYRADAREDLLRALDAMKERLWVPYQVALEFHRRRLDVIAAEKSAFDVAQKSVDSAAAAVAKLFDSNARNPHSTPPIQQALASLQAAAVTINAELKIQRDQQLAVGDEDRILERLETLFGNKVGSPPTSELVNAIAKEGETRYAALVPPGYADSKKGETYIDRGITYESKFGDLVIWKQIIAQAKNAKLRAVLFVSDDKKDDWWNNRSGLTLGPHPYLVEEIKREGGVELFHMYSSDQFLRFAADRGIVQLGPDTINQVQETNAIQAEEAIRSGPSPVEHSVLPREFVRKAIKSDLQTRFPDAKLRDDGNYKFLVDNPDDLFGTRVQYMRFSKLLEPGTLQKISDTARGLIDETRTTLEDPELYIVVPEELVSQFAARLGPLQVKLGSQLKIRLGYIADFLDDITEPFVPVEL